MIRDVERRIRRLEERCGHKRINAKLQDGGTAELDAGEAVEVMADSVELYSLVAFRGGSKKNFDPKKLVRLELWAKINDGRRFATYATMARHALAATQLDEKELNDLVRSCAGPWISEENIEGYKRGPTEEIPCQFPVG